MCIRCSPSRPHGGHVESVLPFSFTSVLYLSSPFLPFSSPFFALFYLISTFHLFLFFSHFLSFCHVVYQIQLLHVIFILFPFLLMTYKYRLLQTVLMKSIFSSNSTEITSIDHSCLSIQCIALILLY